jgi:hypothetical protein
VCEIFTKGIFLVIVKLKIALGGLVVSVLATGPKVRGFKPGQGRRILRVIKSAARLPSEGKWSRRSHVVDLRHVKEPYEHDRCSSAKFRDHISHSCFICFVTRCVLALLTDVFGGRIRMTRTRFIVGLITSHRTSLTIAKNRKGRPSPDPGCCATDDDVKLKPKLRSVLGDKCKLTAFGVITYAVTTMTNNSKPLLNH